MFKVQCVNIFFPFLESQLFFDQMCLNNILLFCLYHTVLTSYVWSNNDLVLFMVILCRLLDQLYWLIFLKMFATFSSFSYPNFYIIYSRSSLFLHFYKDKKCNIFESRRHVLFLFHKYKS